MSIEQLWCKECKAIFDNIEEYNKFHNKPSVKVFSQKHSYISSKNNFELLLQLIDKNTELINQINIQNSKMEILSQRINFLEDSFRDFFFECNISLNIKNKGIGICYLNYLPKSINFKIEYTGSLLETKEIF